jgi:hypothetical protein
VNITIIKRLPGGDLRIQLPSGRTVTYAAGTSSASAFENLIGLAEGDATEFLRDRG